MMLASIKRGKIYFCSLRLALILILIIILVEV